MSAKRIAVAIVGMTQAAIGMLAFALTFTLYYDLLSIQTALDVSHELLPLSLLILGIFGFFSVTSGIFLLHEH